MKALKESGCSIAVNSASQGKAAINGKFSPTMLIAYHFPAIWHGRRNSCYQV